MDYRVHKDDPVHRANKMAIEVLVEGGIPNSAITCTGWIL